MDMSLASTGSFQDRQLEGKQPQTTILLEVKGLPM
jgi:hypothetical protein